MELDYPETFSRPMIPNDYWDLIPETFIKVQIKTIRWLDYTEAHSHFGIELLPTASRYAHEVFVVIIDRKGKLGFLGEKLFFITTGKVDFSWQNDVVDVAHSIIGKQLCARVVLLGEKGKYGHHIYFDYRLVDLAPLSECHDSIMEDVMFLSPNVLERSKEKEAPL